MKNLGIEHRVEDDRVLVSWSALFEKIDPTIVQLVAMRMSNALKSDHVMWQLLCAFVAGSNGKVAKYSELKSLIYFAQLLRLKYGNSLMDLLRGRPLMRSKRRGKKGMAGVFRANDSQFFKSVLFPFPSRRKLTQLSDAGQTFSGVRISDMQAVMTNASPLVDLKLSVVPCLLSFDSTPLAQGLSLDRRRGVVVGLSCEGSLCRESGLSLSRDDALTLDDVREISSRSGGHRGLPHLLKKYGSFCADANEVHVTDVLGRWTHPIGVYYGSCSSTTTEKFTTWLTQLVATMTQCSLCLLEATTLGVERAEDAKCTGIVCPACIEFGVVCGTCARLEYSSPWPAKRRCHRCVQHGVECKHLVPVSCVSDCASAQFKFMTTADLKKKVPCPYFADPGHLLRNIRKAIKHWFVYVHWDGRRGLVANVFFYALRRCCPLDFASVTLEAIQFRDLQSMSNTTMLCKPEAIDELKKVRIVVACLLPRVYQEYDVEDDTPDMCMTCAKCATSVSQHSLLWSCRLSDSATVISSISLKFPPEVDVVCVVTLPSDRQSMGDVLDLAIVDVGCSCYVVVLQTRGFIRCKRLGHKTKLALLGGFSARGVTAMAGDRDHLILWYEDTHELKLLTLSVIRSGGLKVSVSVLFTDPEIADRQVNLSIKGDLVLLSACDAECVRKVTMVLYNVSASQRVEFTLPLKVPWIRCCIRRVATDVTEVTAVHRSDVIELKLKPASLSVSLFTIGSGSGQHSDGTEESVVWDRPQCCASFYESVLIVDAVSIRLATPGWCLSEFCRRLSKLDAAFCLGDSSQQCSITDALRGMMEMSEEMASDVVDGVARGAHSSLVSGQLETVRHLVGELEAYKKLTSEMLPGKLVTTGPVSTRHIESFFSFVKGRRETLSAVEYATNRQRAIEQKRVAAALLQASVHLQGLSMYYGMDETQMPESESFEVTASSKLSKESLNELSEFVSCVACAKRVVGVRAHSKLPTSSKPLAVHGESRSELLSKRKVLVRFEAGSLVAVRYGGMMIKMKQNKFCKPYALSRELNFLK